jgi:hypothetical protein
MAKLNNKSLNVERPISYERYITMKVHCEKCKTVQTKAEKFCLNCGERLGGFKNNKFSLIGLIFVSLSIPFMFATSKTGQFTDIFNPILFFRFYLPVLALGLLLYDYHPTRISIYFYGTALIVTCHFIFSN